MFQSWKRPHFHFHKWNQLETSGRSILSSCSHSEKGSEVGFYLLQMCNHYFSIQRKSKFLMVAKHVYTHVRAHTHGFAVLAYVNSWPQSSMGSQRPSCFLQAAETPRKSMVNPSIGKKSPLFFWPQKESQLQSCPTSQSGQSSHCTGYEIFADFFSVSCHNWKKGLFDGKTSCLSICQK